jgi:hypothetical protein
LVRGYRRLLPTGKQLFGFLASVSNPTDTNNSIARAELSITYVLENDATVACRLNHERSIVNRLNADGACLSGKGA